MKAQRRFGSAEWRRAWSLPLLVLLSVTSGCALTASSSANSLGRPPGFLSTESSLAPADAWFRYYMRTGTADSAIAMFAAPEANPVPDALLSALQQSVLLRSAGSYEESNELLEWANGEIERRSIRSVSRTAGAYLLTERALDYLPAPSERLMIPLYRMLNYTDLRDRESAAVEARRISLISQETGDEIAACALYRTADHLAGLVLESVGEEDDALVALRRADRRSCGSGANPEGLDTDLYRIARRTGFLALADSIAARLGENSDVDGVHSPELIVVVERGFVANRVAESLYVPVVDDDLAGLRSDASDGIVERSGSIASRIAAEFAGLATWELRDHRFRYRDRGAGLRFLEVTWPGLEWAPGRGAERSLLVNGVEFGMAGRVNLSGIADGELAAARAGTLTRAISRAVFRYLASTEAERRAEEKGGELLGYLAGRLVNAAGNEIDSADTRSWSLLPEELSIVRVSVPPGQVSLDIANEGEDGTWGRVGPMDVGEGDRWVVGMRLIEPDARADLFAGQ